MPLAHNLMAPAAQQNTMAHHYQYGDGRDTATQNTLAKAKGWIDPICEGQD